jgi:hypothetical protein
VVVVIAAEAVIAVVPIVVVVVVVVVVVIPRYLTSRTPYSENIIRTKAACELGG